MLVAAFPEDVANRLCSVVKDEPFHQLMIVVLALVDFDKTGDEAAPVVGGGDYGDDHVCFRCVAAASQILDGLKRWSMIC